MRKSDSIGNFDWGSVVDKVVGLEPPEDTFELRKSFFESVMTDQNGNPIKQAGIHDEIQGFIYNLEAKYPSTQLGIIVRAPYNTGKSQQLVGLITYLSTLRPELEHLVVSADGGISSKRIAAVRMLIRKPSYIKWCKSNNIKPLVLSKADTDSTNKVIFESKNTTGNPSVEAYAVLTKTTGQRCTYLWLDDVCNDDDRTSPKRRDQVNGRINNIWIKRAHDKGRIIVVCTPYHPQDANSKLFKSGTFNALQISVTPDKTQYKVEQWINE